MDILRSGQTDNFEYRIIHDDFQLESPREWDNLGTMVCWCWHNHHILGDEQRTDNPPMGWLTELLTELYPEKLHDNNWYEWLDNAYYGEDGFSEKAWKFAHERAIILPLYLYDHSGISISTSSFSGRAHHAEWDSGQVGWIYVSIADVKEEYGWKNLTQKRRAKIEKYLRNEVETYDQYLTGQVYGYEVFEVDKETKGEQYECLEDSCYGFYGLDYCEEEARSSMAYYQSEKNKKDDGLERLMVIHANELEKMVSV